MVGTCKLQSELSKVGRKRKYDETAKMVKIASQNFKGSPLSTYSLRTFS